MSLHRLLPFSSGACGSVFMFVRAKSPWLLQLAEKRLQSLFGGQEEGIWDESRLLPQTTALQRLALLFQCSLASLDSEDGEKG